MTELSKPNQTQAYADLEFLISQLKNYRDEAAVQTEHYQKMLHEILDQISAGDHNEELDFAFKNTQKKWKFGRDHVTELDDTILHESLKLAHLKEEL